MADRQQVQRTTTRREAEVAVETKPGDLELLKRIEEILDEVEEVLETNEEVMATPECATCPCGYAPEECYRWQSGEDVPITVKDEDHWTRRWAPWLSR